MDFEPYDSFQSAEENADWIHAWTGNQTLDGAEYRIFGQDGTGGLAAIWIARAGAPLLDQPIVFAAKAEFPSFADDFRAKCTYK
jgi:hypothetical protein